jgi:hypothetical protein
MDRCYYGRKSGDRHGRTFGAVTTSARMIVLGSNCLLGGSGNALASALAILSRGEARLDGHPSRGDVFRCLKADLVLRTAALYDLAETQCVTNKWIENLKLE